jgi:hypothetical protein
MDDERTNRNTAIGVLVAVSLSLLAWSTLIWWLA